MTPNSNTHSYFWRHPEQMEALAKHVRRFPSGGELSVWSAGCAQGEEPYSLAFLLESYGFNFNVLATDISDDALRAARKGVYREEKLRSLPLQFRLKELSVGEFEIPERVRKTVQFRLSDLRQTLSPQPIFHLVSCRNVLIYFEPSVQREILDRLVQSLHFGGLLVMGYAESSLMEIPGLSRLDEHGIFLRTPLSSPLTTPLPQSSNKDDSLQTAIRSFAHGELKIAKTLFEGKLEERPDFVICHYFKALIELELGHLTEATAHLNSVLSSRAPFDSATADFLRERRVSDQQFLNSATLARRRVEALL